MTQKYETDILQRLKDQYGGYWRSAALEKFIQLLLDRDIGPECGDLKRWLSEEVHGKQDTEQSRE